MSASNQNRDNLMECPLCLEPLDVDDLNFFPCTCSYQICRFCWHRIRTDENGLCPACRKAYPEDPADFKPLSKEDFARMKAEKRQKNQQKKQKITENRKNLNNVRVVQKNLVFVLGLPARLADAEVLKRHEYFGKFGKILKVVINQCSAAYVGNQFNMFCMPDSISKFNMFCMPDSISKTPSASAYVTYSRSDDALRAIQAVNNIQVENRVIKTSLGTTKYCAHFMKNQTCLKTECMYLHDFADPEASFTKEEMQLGRHQEYEKRLHEQLINSTLAMQGRKPTPSPPSVQLDNSPNASGSVSNSNRNSPTIAHLSAKEEWPSLRPLSPMGNYSESQNDVRETSKSASSMSEKSSSSENVSDITCSKRHHSKHNKKKNTHKSYASRKPNENDATQQNSELSDPTDTHLSNKTRTVVLEEQYDTKIAHPTVRKASSGLDSTPPPINEPNEQLSRSPTTALLLDSLENDNNSFFSSNTFPCSSENITNNLSANEWLVDGETDLPDVLPPVHSSEDWAAAFGFSTTGQTNDERIEPNAVDDNLFKSDDDLGFDPFTETQKALAEMIETEKQQTHSYYNSNSNSNNSIQNANNLPSRCYIMQNNNRLTNCAKLLDDLCINSMPQRTHVPPPGFTNTTTNHLNSFGLGIPRTVALINPALLRLQCGSGNKFIPYAQQTLNAFQQHNTPASWDWSALDPAIMSAAAAAAAAPQLDLYATQPPPGFSLTASALDPKFMFNGYM